MFNIDWPSFTPWHSLAGGALIGLASAIYVLGAGRIAGMAGILGGALEPLTRRVGAKPSSARDQSSRWFFLIGLLAAPWVWRWWAALPPSPPVASTLTVILAGLLVGVGVRMGNGCTSGHGVCGLSRGSLRSLANVLAFMGAGLATVAVMRHWLTQA